jgi:hypothetical protein
MFSSLISGFNEIIKRTLKLEVNKKSVWKWFQIYKRLQICDNSNKVELRKILIWGKI